MLRIIKTRQKAKKGRLAAAGLAHDGDGGARRRAQTDAAQHRTFFRVVAEVNVAILDPATGAGERARAADVLERLVENFKHARARGDALLQRHEYLNQPAQRRGDEEQARQK